MCDTKEELIKQYDSICDNVDSEKKKLFEKLRVNSFDTVEDNIVTGCNVCFLLSCPEEEEMRAGKAASGSTGDNLAKIMDILRAKPDVESLNPKLLFSDSFSLGKKQHSYNIINACNHVYFRLVNFAEPEIGKILDETNIKRIKQLLKENRDIFYFVLCGNNAEIVFNEIKDALTQKFKFVVVSHIGNVGLRNEYKNSFIYDKNEKIGNLPEPERDNKRLELVAKEIFRRIQVLKKRLFPHFSKNADCSSNIRV